MNGTTPKLPLRQEIVDTLVICTIYAVTALIGSALIFRLFIGFCFVMAIVEIFVNSLYVDEGKNHCGAFNVLMTIILGVAIYLLFQKKMTSEQYVLWIGAVTAADACGLFFGKLFGSKRPFFSKNISPNKTYAGYIGEIVGSIAAGWIIIVILKIPLLAANVCFASTGFIACVIGDLLGSAAKRELGIKNSECFLLDKPVLGKIERLMRSRHGFLDCFDSASVAFIYFIILL